MRIVSAIALFAIGLLAEGCGNSLAAPRPKDVSGSWAGNGSDNQGAETFNLVLTQTDSEVNGTVTTMAVDPSDGSCASCHKNKIGVVSGSISGAALKVTMSFPTGGDVPTPICSVTMDVPAAFVTTGQIVANYSGGDSCEGPFVNGAFTLVKK
jgi:hypothetical protein